MGAGPVRLLSLAWCIGIAAALLGVPRVADARATLSLVPSADTARFLACMRGAANAPQRTAAPVSAVKAATAGAAGALPPAVPLPAASAGPGVLYCLAFVGYPERPPLVAATTVCLRQSSVIATACLNRVFAALNPVVAGLPTAVPAAATPVQTAPPRPTPVVVAAVTPPPTPHPTPKPAAVTAAPRPTLTARLPGTRKPSALPSPRLVRTPRPSHTVRPPSASGTLPPPGTAAPAGTPSAIVLAAGGGSEDGRGGPGRRVSPLLVGGAALVLAALAVPLGYFTGRRRAPHQKEPHMHQLEIVTPREASLAVAGAPVTFAVRTDPPQLAAGVRWSVPTQPGAPGAHGIGPAFTYTFGATGVEQVVAHLDDGGLTCDVVVYVFKTRTGGSALADILRSEPPPVARSVESLRRWGASALAPRRAS